MGCELFQKEKCKYFRERTRERLGEEEVERK